MLMMEGIPYFLFFSLALCVANAIFLLRQMPRPHFFLKLCFSILSVLIVSEVLIDIVSSLTDAFWVDIITYTCMLLIFVPIIRFCFVIDWSTSLFCALAGYSVQHIASVTCEALFYNAIIVYIPHPFNITNLARIAVYILIFIMAYYIFGRQICPMQKIDIKKKKLLLLLLLAVIGEVALADIFRVRILLENDAVVFYAVRCINILCSVAILLLQFNLLQQKTLERELEILKQLRLKEQHQYQISKDTIELINIKCHDMRHQIHMIGQESRIDPTALNEMEQTIGIYDAMVKTQNQALDTILAEKSLYCQKHQIMFSCIADAACMGFIHDAEIYSLFGNLLDNAINAVLPLEPEKRVIGLIIKNEKEMVSIHSYNYYAGEILLGQGYPITKQKDTNEHGFGVRSMQIIVEKYQGSILFHPEDNVFYLDILIPIKKKDNN